MQILVCKFWCENFGVQILVCKLKLNVQNGFVNGNQINCHICQMQNGITLTNSIEHILESQKQTNNLPHMCGFVNYLRVPILNFRMLLRN